MQNSNLLDLLSPNTTHSEKQSHSHNPTTPISLWRRTVSSDAEGFKDGKPTLQYASSLNKTWSSMSNEQILHFAHMEVPEACRECIIRDVMMVDQVEYDEVRREKSPLCTFS